MPRRSSGKAWASAAQRAGRRRHAEPWGAAATSTHPAESARQGRRLHGCIRGDRRRVDRAGPSQRRNTVLTSLPTVAELQVHLWAAVSGPADVTVPLAGNAEEGQVAYVSGGPPIAAGTPTVASDRLADRPPTRGPRAGAPPSSIAVRHQEQEPVCAGAR